MSDFILLLKNNLAEHFVIYFIPLYYFGGRPVALLSAQLLGYKVSFLFPVAVLLDIIQVPLFFHLNTTLSKNPFIQKIRKGRKKKEVLRRNSKLFRWVQALGIPGVIVIVMLPLKGCGMLSGFILSRLLQLSKLQVYTLLAAGSILGCGMLLGLGELILTTWIYVRE